MKGPDPREAILMHLPALRAFAMTLTKDESKADDLIQDTVVRAWSKFDQFKDGTNLRAWLFTILRNSFFSSIRKQRFEVDDPVGLFSNQVAEKPAHDGRLQLQDFHSAFGTLPVDQRETLILVGASGFSYEEAAEMCGVPVGTVKSRANRGRKRLAELLQIDESTSLELTDAATDAIVKSSRRSPFK